MYDECDSGRMLSLRRTASYGPENASEKEKTRGEQIPQESQFMIPIFWEIGPLSNWSNSLKTIDSFHGIVVHNS